MDNLVFPAIKEVEKLFQQKVELQDKKIEAHNKKKKDSIMATLNKVLYYLEI